MRPTTLKPVVEIERTLSFDFDHSAVVSWTAALLFQSELARQAHTSKEARMSAPASCRPASIRRRGSLVAVAILLHVQGAFAADAPPVPVHHPHRHPHHARPHRPVHTSKPVAVVPLPPVPPSTPPVPAVGTKTGLPLPRFASLRADEVNMRSGPGSQYPILWLYKRRDLPVQIEREFDLWRLVEDSDGVKGWVHTATLVGTRSFVVIANRLGAGSRAEAAAVDPGVGPGVGVHGAGTLLRDEPRDNASIVAILRPGVIGRLRACPAQSDWCRVSTHNYSGWLLRSAIFGLLPNEVITPS